MTEIALVVLIIVPLAIGAALALNERDDDLLG